MLFIIEGIKGSGKTTLAKEICSSFNVPYFNERGSGVFFNDLKPGEVRNLVAKHVLFVELEFFKQVDFCIDRFHISEAAYRIINGENKIDYFNEIEKEIIKISHMLIFCKTDIDVAKSRLYNRDGVIPDNLELSYEIFWDIYSGSKLNKIAVTRN